MALAQSEQALARRYQVPKPKARAPRQQSSAHQVGLAPGEQEVNMPCTPQSPRNWRGLNKNPSCSMHKQYRQWRNEMTPYM